MSELFYGGPLIKCLHTSPFWLSSSNPQLVEGQFGVHFSLSTELVFIKLEIYRRVLKTLLVGLVLTLEVKVTLNLVKVKGLCKEFFLHVIVNAHILLTFPLHVEQHSIKEKMPPKKYVIILTSMGVLGYIAL